MTTYTYSIETSDDGTANDDPLKIWQIISTGTETQNIEGPAGEYAQALLDMYLMDHTPAGGHDLRAAVWDKNGELPLEDIRTAAAVVYAPDATP